VELTFSSTRAISAAHQTPSEPSVQLTKILECLAVWSTLVLLLLLGRHACRHFCSRFCASLTLLQLQLLLPPLPFSTIHLLENRFTLKVLLLVYAPTCYCCVIRDSFPLPISTHPHQRSMATP
jgi:hypothetical protein